MPILSRFFGIVVFMNWRDHAPPHFHARYGEDDVIVAIESGEVTGFMSRRALGMLEEWRKQHQTELLANWNLAQQGRTLNRIQPLE